MDYVIDTNVLINASDYKDAQVKTSDDIICQLKCVEFVEDIYKEIKKPHPVDQVLVDGLGLILDEYKKYSGNNGIGGGFIKFVTREGISHLTIIKITEVSDDRGFDNLQQSTAFDADDKMFLAVAKKGGGVVVNSTDDGWKDNKEFVKSHGVTVKELCKDLCQ